MIRKIGILLCSLGIAFSCVGQRSTSKPAITPAEFRKFPSAGGGSLSNDGNYVLYGDIDPSDKTVGSYIKGIHSGWKSEKVGWGMFTSDSRYFIYMKEDTLSFLNLQKKKTEFIPGVNSFKYESKHVAWKLNGDSKLIIRSIETKKEKSFEDVIDYYFNKDGTGLLLVTAATSGLQSVQWVNLADSRKIDIWTSEDTDSKAGSFTFPIEGNAVAFIVENKSGKTLCYFDGTKGKAVMIANDQIKAIDENLRIDGIHWQGFTGDGTKLLTKLVEITKPPASQNGYQGVDIWSYTDEKLQSQQLNELKNIDEEFIVGIVNLKDNKFMVLQKRSEILFSITDNYALIAVTTGADNEWKWKRTSQTALWLVSLSDGGRTLIKENVKYILRDVSSSYRILPGEKYVVYFDPDERDYFSYEIATGTKRNVSVNVNATWTTYIDQDAPIGAYMPIGFAGTLSDDEAVLIYDQFEIYMVDPTGKNIPINLTNEYGRRNNIELRLALDDKKVFAQGETVILSGFNRKNKNDGFYKIKIGRKTDPELLISAPYIFKGTWEDDRQFTPQVPRKAKDAEVYVVRRMSAKESPDCFWTTDFKVFNRLSNVHPEKDYNWMTTELINFTLPDGSPSQGILYKPENLDPAKKYPVIFHYYEQMTEGLHGFISPDVSDANLNIPYFVSNGYMVFTPDIHYTIGHPGQSVVNTMVAAAQVLGKRPYVDATRMGLQGHSRGGWETNFIVTHTNIFAAAMSGAGFCNYTNLYNGVRFDGEGGQSAKSRQDSFEMLFQRIGATLWEKPELFIENSPIFMADKVTTPVLMFSNKGDDDVPFEQGVQFFTALRRLGKKAWMLQYDGEGHGIYGKAALDFTIRMKQFFDHYLKGEPAPKWMLYGIPAKNKGIDDGLELVKEKDKDGNWITPGPGLLRTDLEKSNEPKP